VGSSIGGAPRGNIGMAMRRRLLVSWLVAATLLSWLAACSGDSKSAYIEKPVDDVYNQAMDQMVEKRYGDAAKTFEAVESEHPYSIWATKSQLMSAYAYYENGDYGQAIIEADRFIQLHPGNRDAAYAYYLKAISYYVQVVDVGRDQKTTELALKAFEDVIRLFPDSQYARDAKLKLDFTRDHLAGKEMEIGRYYLNKDLYLAAMNRFRTVVNEYQTTTHVPEALERLIECDLALGLTNEARRNAAVLGYNYPGSKWYIDGYELVTRTGNPGEPTEGWLGRAVGSLF
jgi:outer membrane protein assembly factor BamD